MNNTCLLLTVAGLALLPLSGRVLAHSANEPVPRPDEGWKRRQASLNERAAEAGARAQVIFLGDSITQGWEGSGKAVWEKYYAGRNAVNLGIGGDRTQHVLWRLDNGNLEGLRPKVAVVMIGTNNSNGEDNTVEQIAEGVAAIVQRLREKLPDTKVLLVAIFPRGENPNPQRGKILQVNQILRRLADGENVLWADFGHKFVTAQGRIPAELMPDFLHLSTAGYALWAESIEPRLARLLGDTRIRPETAAAAPALTGEWVLTVPGPNDEPVEMPLTLQQDGNRLSGRVARPGGGWLELEKGARNGAEVSWVIRRPRPDGGSMTYEMSGRWENGQLAGTTTTEMGGGPVTSKWSAKRR